MHHELFWIDLFNMFRCLCWNASPAPAVKRKYNVDKISMYCILPLNVKNCYKMHVITITIMTVCTAHDKTLSKEWRAKTTLASFRETSERQIPSFSISKRTGRCFIDNIQQDTIQKLYEFMLRLEVLLKANAAKTT